MFIISWNLPHRSLDSWSTYPGITPWLEDRNWGTCFTSPTGFPLFCLGRALGTWHEICRAGLSTTMRSWMLIKKQKLHLFMRGRNLEILLPQPSIQCLAQITPAAWRLGSVGCAERWQRSEDRRAAGALHHSRVSWRVRICCLQGGAKLYKLSYTSNRNLTIQVHNQASTI